jgi:hypothetical protein
LHVFFAETAERCFFLFLHFLLFDVVGSVGVVVVGVVVAGGGVVVDPDGPS